MENKPSSAIFAGLSGAIATFPMTAVMFAGEKIWKGRTRPIPPDRVLSGLVDKTDPGKREVLKRDKVFEPLAWTSHFGYGFTAGVAYLTFCKMFSKTPVWFRGSSFGLSVWLTSYWGWLPALKILPPPTKTPKGEMATRAVSHLVWGIVLAEIYDEFFEKKKVDHNF